MNCRVCARPIAGFELDLPAPGLTSLTTTMDAPTRVAICISCGHGQSPDPVNLAAFYDNEYRISLQSDDFDQLHSIEHERPVFRTDRQVETLLNLVDVPNGGHVLDYGAAKAQSTRRLITARPDLQPYLFDVSDDYRGHWRGWIDESRTASYAVPADWVGRFDLVTTYFVLEHVGEPVAHLKELARLLRPGGRLFAIVPDPLANTGDLLILDHVNHFTRASIEMACAWAGLKVEGFDTATFTGGLAFAARLDDHPVGPAKAEVVDAVDGLRAASALWSRIYAGLAAAAAARRGTPFVVHGAGFYGSFVLQRMGEQADVRAVLDANPHLQGGTLFNRPIVAPTRLPDDVDTIVVALNPAVAQSIVGHGEIYGRSGLDLIFLADL